MYGFFYPFNTFGTILGWLIFALLIVWILRAMGGGHRHWDKRAFFEDPALAILKERYAKGEISKEEFEERKRNLMK
jgi:putative membrane protein